MTGDAVSHPLYQAPNEHFFCVSLHQWAEYILFASLLVLVCIIFAIMAYFYTYTDPTKIEAQFDEMEPEEKEKRKNFDMPRKGSAESHKEDRRSSDSSSDDECTKQTKI